MSKQFHPGDSVDRLLHTKDGKKWIPGYTVIEPPDNDLTGYVYITGEYAPFIRHDGLRWAAVPPKQLRSAVNPHID